MVLVAGLYPNRAIAEPVRGQSCFWGPWLGNLPLGQRPYLKMALLSLGFHWGLTVSYLKFKALRKVFMSMDGYYIIIAEGGST